MDIKSFNRPEKNPIGLLDGVNVRQKVEKEDVLAMILLRCVDAGEFKPIKTKYGHMNMVVDGLLSGDYESGYELTKLSKGLLYTIYGKE